MTIINVKSTPDFEVEVDTNTARGWFEHNELGDECGGELWFDRLVGGVLALTDYDGVFELPEQVKQTLTANGIVVSEEF